MDAKTIVFDGKYRFVHPETKPFFFRALSADEEKQFVAWARSQPEGTVVNPTIWHPVVQDELLRTKRGTLGGA